jgi:hypothetical protein
MVGVVVVALCLFPYRRTATAEQVRSLDGAATGGGRE